MKTYLVDTDIIIYWLRGKHPHISQKIEEIDSNALRLSAITVAELYFGAHNSSKPQENLQLLEELLAEVRVIPFEVSTAAVFGQVKTGLRQSGYTISDSDIFIAATALAHGIQPTFTRVAFNNRFDCSGVLIRPSCLLFSERVNTADAGR